MPTTTNEIAGGAFQTILGDTIANGYLTFELSEDCIANTTTQVCAGAKITVQLDSNGNVIASSAVQLWPNDVLTPALSYYTVSAFTAQGQIAWGPNAQRVLSSPSPFLLGAWVPGETDL